MEVQRKKKASKKQVQKTVTNEHEESLAIAEKKGWLSALNRILEILKEEKEKTSVETPGASYSDYFLGRQRGRTNLIYQIEKIIEESK